MFNSYPNIESGKFMDFYSILDYKNNTILFKEDIEDPKDDRLFLEHGFKVKKTQGYSFRFVFDGKFSSKLIVCKDNCWGVEKGLVNDKLVYDTELTEDVEKSLINVCKLFNTNDDILEIAYTDINNGNELDKNVEIAARSCYLNNIDACEKNGYNLVTIYLSRII
jgi:hypothetical protein